LSLNEYWLFYLSVYSTAISCPHIIITLPSGRQLSTRRLTDDMAPGTRSQSRPIAERSIEGQDTAGGTLPRQRTDSHAPIEGRETLVSTPTPSLGQHLGEDTPRRPSAAGDATTPRQETEVREKLRAVEDRIRALKEEERLTRELREREKELETLLQVRDTRVSQETNSERGRNQDAGTTTAGRTWQPRAPKTRELKPYRGKTVKEAEDFFYDAELKWRQDEDITWKTDAAKITHCVSAFEGTPKTIWRRKEAADGIDTMMWEDFKEFMKDSVSDPENRNMDALLKWEEAKQREGQSVQSFVAYLDQQEDELGIYDDFQKRNNLLAKLREDIRMRIDDEMHIPRKREELIALAIRKENNINRYSRGRPRNTYQAPRRERSLSPRTEPAYSRTRSPKRETTRERGGPSTAPNNEPIRTRNVADVVCYKCQKKGHYATKCPDKTCYNCGRTGHLASTCVAPKDSGKGNGQL
jgi:hypothetical protein